ELSASLRSACASLIDRLKADSLVKAVTVAGNSVMEHLFLGITPVSMAKIPYKPLFKEARTVAAGEAGLGAVVDCPVYIFPMIGGFVGGDAVAAALALDLYEEKENTLLVDIGTNSEIILKANGRLYATSAAAGPAFEAAGINRGMTAGTGAIRGVTVADGSMRLDVIGSVTARGICGSGLLDAVSVLLNEGVIDNSGRILDAVEVSSSLSGRIKGNEQGNLFILSQGPKGAIAITQDDIRALQVAKAAIRAGITTLMEKADLQAGDIKKIHIAGAFGSNLSMRGLVDIGLIDTVWAGALNFAGDAALEGAALALREDKKSEAEWLAKNTTYQPLSGSKVFESEFLRHMDFPAGRKI
ncbi:MAG: ASKHA domain-containing protein, partial [Thermodesulfobacteriota bacterium]